MRYAIIMLSWLGLAACETMSTNVDFTPTINYLEHIQKEPRRMTKEDESYTVRTRKPVYLGPGDGPTVYEVRGSSGSYSECRWVGDVLKCRGE